MADFWRLDNLPTDVLIIIFDYCHAFDLVRLSEVCSRFHDIVRDNTLWIKKSKQPLATNQASKRFRDRCNPLLCLRTKWHVSQNWQYGKFEKKILVAQKTRLMPWLQLTQNVLWWSGNNQLCGYKRNEPFRENNRIFFEGNIGSDICKFVVRDKSIITGHTDGSIKVWTKANVDNHLYCSVDRAHNSDVNAVDQCGNNVISGAADGTVKIWNWNSEKVSNMPSETILMSDRVWSLAADPTGTKFGVGSSGYSREPPIRIFDIKRCDESNILKDTWRRGAGVLDIVWESPNTLLTCGYDTCIRKWDLRTGICVTAWSDPTDATLYCISSDYQYTMLAGTQFNGTAVLWDQRQMDYVQLFYIGHTRVSSPVYCLTFDSSHLYGAVDRRVIELTFSGYSYRKIDYREIFRRQRRPFDLTMKLKLV